MDELKIIRCVKRATDNIEQALSCAHQYRDSQKLKEAVQRLDVDIQQLLSIFLESAGVVEEFWALKQGKRYLFRILRMK